MRPILVIAALAAALGFECKRPNGAYCDDARPCPVGLQCDLVERECHGISTGTTPDLAVNMDMAGCSCGGATPICVAMSCVSCLSTSNPDEACAAASPSTPHCESDGPSVGNCVGCRDDSDCGGVTPFCDATTKTCRGCVGDGECASLICDLTPGSNSHGVCVPTNQVEYVDGNAATNGNGLTPTTPRQKIQDAVNHATGGDNRAYVRVAAGVYNEVVGVSNGAIIYIVGEDGATIRPTNGDPIGSFSGSSMTIRNLIVAAPSGNGGNCQNASFTAYRSQFVNSSQSGMYSSNCSLSIDACWIDSNGAGGIYIAAGNFQVINSIITRNVGSGGLYQVVSGTTTQFTNNTVADNTATGTYAGVSCSTSSSLVVRNSILYNDRGSSGATLAETNCTSSSVATNDPATAAQATVDLRNQAPGFKGTTPTSADSYHLLVGSPCLDKAGSPFPDHDFDFERRPDAKTSMPDIGADEVQQ